jgi:hypothetical protein
MVLNGSGQTGPMHESWQHLFTDSADNFLSFPMPTHTNDFGNHNDGYGHLKTAFARSSADSQKSQSSIGLSFDMVPDSGEIYNF